MKTQYPSVLSRQIDNLHLLVFKNRQKMGESAGYDIERKIKELLAIKNTIRMVFAAAPSQNEVLQHLTCSRQIDWSRITVFHMDEYVGLSKDSPQSFARFLSEKLFNIAKPKCVHLINGLNDVEKECIRYTQLITKDVIDIVVLGIGENGHIAFNDPPVADFNDTKVIKQVKLDEVCRQQQVNDGCFSRINDVPNNALTLTIPTLFSGSYLFCIVPGKTKYNAVNQTLYGPITTNCPASILRHHQNCTLYVDIDSYGTI